MISIVAKFSIKEGREDYFLELTKDLIEASRAEDGGTEYILHKDLKKPGTYCMIEKWKDQKAIDFHNNTPHFTNTVPRIVEIAEVEINLYEPV